MSLTAAERETTVTITDADDTVRIWTAQRGYLGKLRRHPAYTEVASGLHGATEWAEFTIPADRWNPATGAKRQRNLSEEQKTELAERLRRSRETSQDSSNSPVTTGGNPTEVPEGVSEYA